MCLILFALQQHDNFPLVLAANRDEFYGRPTRSAQFWEDAPQILAGRDLELGGTWLGITRQGRLAAVTNIRNPDAQGGGVHSRGDLTQNFLKSDLDPEAYLETLLPDLDQYKGFNLIIGNHKQLYYLNSETAYIEQLSPGVYGLSNAQLDTAWPKVVKGKQALADHMSQGPEITNLITLLADRQPAHHQELPNTGIERALEELLSSRFVITPEYGTRASTSLIVNREGYVDFHEQNYSHNGRPADSKTYRFKLEDG